MSISSTLIDFIPAADLSFQLTPNVERSRTRLGKTITVLRGAGLWLATWTTRDMLHDAAVTLEAKLNQQSGGVNSFYAYDFRRPYPLAYKNGVYPGGFTGTCQINTVTANANTLTLKGLPAGFILSEGDYMHFDYTDPGGVVCRALHQVVTGGVANGSGVTGTLGVRPQIRQGAVANTNVVLSKASAMFKLDPDGVKQETRNALYSGLIINATQTLSDT